MKFVVWNANRHGVPDKPLGKILFPRNYVKTSEDQWYLLINAESESLVTGKLRVRIRYIEDIEIHGVLVTVIEGKDILKDNFGIPNAFVVINIASERDIIHQTKVALKSSAPHFGETFFFPFSGAINSSLELTFTVWYDLN